MADCSVANNDSHLRGVFVPYAGWTADGVGPAAAIDHEAGEIDRNEARVDRYAGVQLGTCLDREILRQHVRTRSLDHGSARANRRRRACGRGRDREKQSNANCGNRRARMSWLTHEAH